MKVSLMFKKLNILILLLIITILYYILLSLNKLSYREVFGLSFSSLEVCI